MAKDLGVTRMEILIWVLHEPDFPNNIGPNSWSRSRVRRWYEEVYLPRETAKQN